jgi:hypothetical protein
MSKSIHAPTVCFNACSKVCKHAWKNVFLSTVSKIARKEERHLEFFCVVQPEGREYGRASSADLYAHTTRLIHFHCEAPAAIQGKN